MPRTFLSITPDADTAVAIEQWRSLCWPATGHFVSVQNYHLTLAFLGEVSGARLQSVQELLTEIDSPGFELTLDEVGYWPDSSTLWLGSKAVPEQLLSLAAECKQIANREGIKVNNRRYNPHLTLVRKAKTLPGPPLIDPDFKVFFDSFQLYQSVLDRSGARYIELNSWPLTQNI